jgi:hypothetical protein
MGQSPDMIHNTFQMNFTYDFNLTMKIWKPHQETIKSFKGKLVSQSLLLTYIKHLRTKTMDVPRFTTNIFHFYDGGY